MSNTSNSPSYTLDSDLVFSLDDLLPSNRNITITTSDNVIYEVPENLLKYSVLLSTALEDKDCSDITLNLVTSEQFGYVLDYLKQLDANKGKASDIPKPIMDSSLTSYIMGWELDFINKSTNNNMLAKLAEASNYLDVKPLLELVCSKIAGLLKGKQNSNEIDSIINSL